MYSNTTPQRIWRFCFCQYGAQCSQLHILRSPLLGRAVLRLVLPCRYWRSALGSTSSFMSTMSSITFFWCAFGRILPIVNSSFCRCLHHSLRLGRWLMSAPMLWGRLNHYLIYHPHQYILSLAKILRLWMGQPWDINLQYDSVNRLSAAEALIGGRSM